MVSRMKLRLFLIASVLSAWFSCQCGPMTTDPCATVRCGTGLTCDPLTGRCASPNTNTGGGGGGGTQQDAGATCTASCSGTTPVCDPSTNTCKICTESLGCTGATPVCQTIANGGLGKCVVCTVNSGCSGATPACDPTVFPNGACVQCVSPDDCPVPGSSCDLNTNTCMAGGTGGGGGSTGPIFFNDAGMTSRCLPVDAGNMACTTECSKGYECVSNICRLRGSTGPIQVTLRWNQPQDLDLYLVEPLPDGGSCEIYYGKPGVNPTPPPIPLPFPIPQSSCGAKGWLDVDSNRACTIDNIDVENIIFDAGIRPTPGTYEVRANYWQNCSGAASTPYEVEVRANGVTRWFCGTFSSNDANGGGAGAGLVITTFTLR